MEKITRHLNLFCESLKGIDRDSASEEFVKKVMEMEIEIEQFAEKLRDDIELRQKARLRILQNEGLTDKTSDDKTVGVKSEWFKLKKKIQAATADAGGKSKLADFLRVDLTQLSKWLTDSDSAREPGADYTLRMQAWVNDPKRQK